MKKFLIAGFMVLMLLPLVSISGAESILYGPKVYTRTDGAPNVFNEAFTAPPGGAFLVIFNGDDEQDSRVDSGSVLLNGSEVVSGSDLNEQVDRVIQPVALTASNNMQITLSGEPGGYIVLMIINDRRNLPELTAGRIQLSWTSIADPSRTVQLRLKNGSPHFARYFRVRYFNEDGWPAATSSAQQLAPHASLNTPVQSYLPAGSTWQTGSVEIVFAGAGGGRILGFGIETNGSAQTETAVPLQFGGLRHYFHPVKNK